MSLDRSSWNAPAICPASSTPRCCINVFQERDLALIDEERQLARFREIDLGGQKRDRSQATGPFLLQPSSRDRKQCPAEAIARGMDRASRNQLVDHVDGGIDPELAIVIEAEIPIGRPGVAP
ncbi:hypothetical protein ACVWY5_000240 [Bradyrhizobium sp. USDA 3256]